MKAIKDDQAFLTRENIQDVYPLTPLQEGIFFHHLYDPTSAAYFEQYSYRISGDLDTAYAERSLNELLMRHDVLRTVFIQKPDHPPLQVVLKTREAVFHGEDISGREDKYAYLDQYKQKDRQNSFVLGQDPLIRLAVFKLADREYELLWSHHHIIMDGWCQGILISEFAEIYNSFKESRHYRLPPEEPYRLYIEWLQQQDKDRARSFWAHYLADYREAAGIPKKQVRKGESAVYRKECASLVLGQPRTNQVNRLAAAHQVTVSVLIQTVWGILLAKYAGKRDAVFGLVVSGRPARVAGVESMVGLFINTIPVRIRYRQGARLAQLLREVQEQAIDSESFHYHSLAEIQSLTPLKQHLIDHILVFENFPIEQQVGQAHFQGGTGGRPDTLAFSVTGIFDQTNYDLNISIVPGEKLVIQLEYNAQVYDGESIKRVLSHLDRLFDQVLADDTAHIDRLSLLTPAEKEQLLAEFNRLERPYPEDQTILALFENQVEKAPHHPALVFENSHLTYKCLDNRANHLAQSLIRQGLMPRSVVGILAERSVEMIVAVMAVMKAGAAFLPLDTDYPAERLAWMIKNSSAEILLTYRTTGPGPDFPGTVIDLAAPGFGGETPGNMDIPIRSTDPVYTVYTSGSTGRPKGVIVEHAQLVNIALAWQEAYRLQEFEINLLQLASFAFDVFAGDLARTLINGGKMVICPRDVRTDVAALVALIQKERITLFETLPLLAVHLMDWIYESRVAIDHLELLIIGSDVFHPEDFYRIHSRFGRKMRLVNSYGVAEATIDSSFFEAPAGSVESYRTVPIGRPFANSRLFILDIGKNLQPIGVTGELYIGGRGVARGYLNDPELTAEKFVDADIPIGAGLTHQSPSLPAKTVLSFACGFTNCGLSAIRFSMPVPGIAAAPRLYKTGDLARRMADGNIEFLGRTDQQVKIRGFRIELGEIENRLLAFPGIKEAAALLRDDRLCAYFTAGEPVDLDRVREWLRASLPYYMIPAYFVPLAHLPVSPNGKVDRDALPTPGSRESGRSKTLPTDAIEDTLLRLWVQVLEIDRESVGTEDDFFGLGGHSLKATVLMLKVHKALDVKVPLNRLFETPTIRGLAAYIRAAAREAYAPLSPVEKKTYYPTASAQRRLFVMQHMQPVSTAYNNLLVMEIVFKIDKGLERLAATMRRLIDRHEAFRTSFQLVGEEPVQRVHDRVAFELEVLELKGPKRHKGHKGQELIETIVQDFVRPFDLATPPLFRVGVIQTGENKCILMVDTHHIISDGISQEILMRDFIRLYADREMPGIKLHYKDFSEWQNRRFGAGQIQEQEEYWLSRFKDPAPPLNLPLDFPRPPERSYEGELLVFNLGPGLSERTYSLAQQTDTTLYMVLLAVYTILLWKYTGQEDMAVGSPISGRTHDDLQDMIGIFVNMLAMRNFPRADRSFSEFLQEVKENALKAYENQDYPFEELVGKLRLTREYNRNPIFNTVFQLNNIDVQGQAETDPRIEVGLLAFKKVSAQFDIILAAEEIGGLITLHLTFAKELFRRATAERMGGRFMEILGQVAENKDTRLKDISLAHQLLTSESTRFQEEACAFDF